VKCSVIVAVAAAAGLGGSGTYTVRGTNYDFVLFNTGTTAWQYFSLVGPPGTRFIGGGTATESMTRCVVGPPGELDCGPLSPNIAPPLAHLGFTATLASPVPCGAPFAFSVGSADGSSLTRVGDLTFAGTCTTLLLAQTVPVVHGLPRVGRTLVATPPRWSATPTRVTYRWERCTRGRCSTIAGATTLRLELVRPDLGHTVRIVATATLNGRTAMTRSAGLAVR
jgi:hypothetical protein